MTDLTLRAWIRYQTTTQTFQRRLNRERGEITATTAIIVLLTIAALTAGGIIAGKIVANANNVPSP